MLQTKKETANTWEYNVSNNANLPFLFVYENPDSSFLETHEIDIFV